MKKYFLLLLSSLLLCLGIACGGADQAENSSIIESSSASQESSFSHEHSVARIAPQPSTCTKAGNIEFFFCWGCDGYFLDENATVETTFEATRAQKLPHTGERVDEIPPTCGEVGIKEHWICSVCNNTFADEACKQPLVGTALQLPSLAHEGMIHHQGFPIVDDKNGEIEHWYCAHCEGYFLDADGTEKVTKEEVILYSAINIPDFVIEVPAGRDPVVLQLSDTQIIDGAQARPEHSSGDKITYATPLIKQYCYDYVTEIIQATTPDLIIITGDLVYGAYDDNGSVLKAFIEFMDGFQIPWAPVFGNHEAESKMGIDWQCQQLENGKYCLFEQKTLTGNGNYSVGIKQDGVLKRVFYMLDTNGCTTASKESLANGHTVASVGFNADQIAWYTDQITRLKELSPETKISFAYHIQQAVFGEALEKYGFNQNAKYQDILIDYADNKADGDFGYVGRQMKDAWDASKKVFNGMKALGVDSVFVGHEHCNSASVVYEGIRFQYGQKSSEYDRYNTVTDNYTIIDTAIWKKTGTPLVGGSVVILSKTDGSIKDGYIYYCKNAGGNVDWDKVAQK